MYMSGHKWVRDTDPWNTWDHITSYTMHMFYRQGKLVTLPPEVYISSYLQLLIPSLYFISNLQFCSDKTMEKISGSWSLMLTITTSWFSVTQALLFWSEISLLCPSLQNSSLASRTIAEIPKAGALRDFPAQVPLQHLQGPILFL